MQWLGICLGKKLSYTLLGLQTHVECCDTGGES